MIISDRKERQRLATLYRRVTQHDTAIRDAEGDLVDLASREAALTALLEREEAKRPTDKDEALDAAADALLANPQAPTVTLLERITGARRKREQSLADWRASVAPIKAAIGKAAREQERRRAEIEELKRQRHEAENTALSEAWKVLMAEFEARARQLIADVSDPLDALQAKLFEVQGCKPGGPNLGGPHIQARLRVDLMQQSSASPVTGALPPPALRRAFPSLLGGHDLERARAAALARLAAELAAERG